jgi:hypothetical protein
MTDQKTAREEAVKTACEKYFEKWNERLTVPELKPLYPAYRHEYQEASRHWKSGANWKEHGKAAGPIRNGNMLDEAGDEPLLVIAFKGGRGTADCVRQAISRNMIVLEVKPRPMGAASGGKDG